MSDIEVKQFGEQFVACDGERTAIGKTEEDARQAVLEMQQQNELAAQNATPVKKAVPITPQKGLSWFDGTSWGAK